MYFLQIIPKKIFMQSSHSRLWWVSNLLAFCSKSLFLSSNESCLCDRDGVVTFLLKTWDADVPPVLPPEEGLYLTLPSNRLVMVASTLLVITVCVCGGGGVGGGAHSPHLQYFVSWLGTINTNTQCSMHAIS